MTTLFSVTEMTDVAYPGWLSIDHDADKGIVSITVKNKGKNAALSSIIIDEDSAISMATAIMMSIGKVSISDRKTVKNK